MEKPRWTDSSPPWRGAYPPRATCLLESLLTIPFLERLTTSPEAPSMCWWSRYIFIFILFCISMQMQYCTIYKICMCWLRSLITLRSMLCMQPMRRTAFNCYGATTTSPNSLVYLIFLPTHLLLIILSNYSMWLYRWDRLDLELYWSDFKINLIHIDNSTCCLMHRIICPS